MRWPPKEIGGFIYTFCTTPFLLKHSRAHAHAHTPLSSETSLTGPDPSQSSSHLRSLPTSQGVELVTSFWGATELGLIGRSLI